MDKLTRLVVKLKSRALAKKIRQEVRFPIEASSVKKVLVIMPRNLELLDKASLFVQSLRKTYPGWKIELFDVDKLNDQELNRVKLPRQEIVHKLKSAQYQFVLDLNDHIDPLTSYITISTEAPYRLHIQAEASNFYNIIYTPQMTNEGFYYEPLLMYLRNLFVKN